MAPGFPLDIAVSKNNCTQMNRKIRKVSKGKSSKFETMADSEGYGSSGRIDTEFTGSDDSCAPRNRSFNLNSDSYQVSLSKLSRTERKQLESRLKRELERVRLFQKTIDNMPTSSRPIKKRAPLPPVVGKAMLMRQCDTLLNRLMAQKYAYVFNDPVDVVALKIPDYFTVIKHPMDLGTVKTKLNSGKYVDPWGFAADVRLTFSNALTYNPRGNDVHIMAESLSKFFEVRWKPIEKKLSVATEPEPELETPTLMPPLKKKKIASFGNGVKQVFSPVKKVMSAAERQKLGSDLEDSLAELPEFIIDFLKENSLNGNAGTEDEIEIDIDAISDEKLFKLRNLLDEFLSGKQKNMAKPETCEMEIHNESGPSNSSMQTLKVNDVYEEDVDIGVDDLPITSFPPVEIEKDTVVKNSKCSSSSSSSSSDSGSSSSSSSDSDSESDDANISTIVNNIKDTVDSEVNLEQTSAVPRDTEDSVTRAGQVEQKPQSVPVSGEGDGHKDGVGAPNERQVSPDKLYRAALLRGRFADIILKAQEKTTGKVEKEDRERLRLEKEELEKRRKEEKARMQAEAKAAEEAKRKAELEAAAEAKRKRELEREAARQALQKMEKMVDINDSSQILEDLEMLTVAPNEPLQNLIDENSADCYQDPLGSFNMNRTGNPLEQLGLYMKNDDEDEDSEGGEID